MAAIKKYYYSDGDKTFGPFNILELKQFGITKETLVWFEGINGWKPAGELNEMKAIIKETTPAFNETTPTFNKTTPAFNLEKKGPTQNDEVLIDFTQNEKRVIRDKTVMFANSFSFSGRIRRLEYGISLIAYYILYLILNAFAIDTPIFGLGYIPLLWFLWAQGAKRCHDLGNNGWYQIIPFYALWMLFQDGQPGLNKYGFNPKG